MDPFDQRIPIEQVLGQEKKWLDVVKIASVPQKDRNHLFATNVVWLIHNGYIPSMSDHQCQRGKLQVVLPQGWAKGNFYQSVITGSIWVYQDMMPGTSIARYEETT